MQNISPASFAAPKKLITFQTYEYAKKAASAPGSLKVATLAYAMLPEPAKAAKKLNGGFVTYLLLPQPVTCHF